MQTSGPRPNEQCLVVVSRSQVLSVIDTCYTTGVPSCYTHGRWHVTAPGVDKYSAPFAVPSQQAINFNHPVTGQVCSTFQNDRSGKFADAGTICATL
jgi:hypothetical protein